MKALALLVSFTLCRQLVAYSQPFQRSIIQDEKGRLVTIETGRTIAPNPTIYLGTAYLGNTVWHQGSLLYRNQREVPAQIAYNIALNEIYWRLADSTETSLVLPDEFTFEGKHFISDQRKPLGVNRVSYFELLYDGRTKLLCRWTKQLRLVDPKIYSHRTPPEEQFRGKYILFREFYLQKEGKRPKFIIPNEYTLSRELPNMGVDLANFIASHELTDEVLIEALIQYDRRQAAFKQSQ